MRFALVALLQVTGSFAATAPTEITMKYIDRDGRFFVSALELEIHAGIAVKPLPGRSELVASRAERCILVDRQESGGDKV